VELSPLEGIGLIHRRVPRAPAGVLLAALLASVALPVCLQAQGRTHAVIVVGLGGSAEYRDRFHAQAVALKSALTERHGIPAENIVYLGERPQDAPNVIEDKSTKDNLFRVLGEVGARSQPLDRLLLVLIGHGTSDRDDTQFNLSGPDLTPSDLQTGLIPFPTQTLALIHTGSASGGFLASLSGPNRIIITATRTERERNFTEFPEFFVEAFTEEGADLNHDERLSLLEAFLYARQEVARLYEEQNEILTEHAMLDDNGDGEGSHDAGLTGPDGLLASTFQLGGVSATAAQVPDDPALARLYKQRVEIQERIGQLRAIRDAMEEDAYLSVMEELLVELALKAREIRALEGGGS
jgi:hypothetical protein